jgi:GLPGLI family protein
MKGIFINDYELIIKNSIAQFMLKREKQKKEHNNITFEIDAENYVNNYNLDTRTFNECRKLNSGALKQAEWTNDMKWVITSEMKIIGGYKSIKATTDSYEMKKDNPYYQGKTFAWFAVDIPFSAGPARYCGLPGLILEISYEKGNSNYKLSKIEYNSTANLADCDTGQQITKADILYLR